MHRRRGWLFGRGGCGLKSRFQQVGLVDIFQGAGIFSDGGGQGVKAYRAAFEVHNQGVEDLAVQLIQSVLVYFQQIQAKQATS